MFVPKVRRMCNYTGLLGFSILLLSLHTEGIHLPSQFGDCNTDRNVSCVFMAVPLILLNSGDQDEVDGPQKVHIAEYVFSLIQIQRPLLKQTSIQLRCTRFCGRTGSMSLKGLDRPQSLVWFPLQDPTHQYSLPSKKNVSFPSCCLS